MQKREKGSIEARLATVRLGMFTITALVIIFLVALTLLIYSNISPANEVEGVNYTFSNYLSDIGPVVIPSILIVLIAALAINFGYTFYLRNQSQD